MSEKIKEQTCPIPVRVKQTPTFQFHEELREIRRLERILLAKHVIFKKVLIMLKGQSPILKGVSPECLKYTFGYAMQPTLLYVW